MPTIRQIRDEIDNTLTFFDVAEVLSAVSSLIYIALNKLYEQFQLKNLLDELNSISSFLNENVNVLDSETTKKAAIIIGSNLGFCGKFNNNIKSDYSNHIGSLNDYDHITLIGNQLFSLSNTAEKIKFPISKKMKWNDIIENKLQTVNNIINFFEKSNENYEINILSNYFDFQTKKAYLKVSNCIFPHQLNMEKIKSSLEESDFYSSINGIDIDPDPESFIFYSLKFHFKISLLNSLIHSEIGENYNRMNAMNQAKDEIEIILKKLKRLLQKTRQTKITNELLEVIQSH